MRQKGSSAGSSSSGGKALRLERVAGWVGSGIHAAFFTSLDRCACVRLDTIDMTEQPLLLTRDLISGACRPRSSSGFSNPNPNPTFNYHNQCHHHSKSPSPSPGPGTTACHRLIACGSGSSSSGGGGEPRPTDRSGSGPHHPVDGGSSHDKSSSRAYKLPCSGGTTAAAAAITSCRPSSSLPLPQQQQQQQHQHHHRHQPPRRPSPALPDEAHVAGVYALVDPSLVLPKRE